MDRANELEGIRSNKSQILFRVMITASSEKGEEKTGRP